MLFVLLIIQDLRLVLNLSQRLLPHLPANLPRREHMSLAEYILHLFQRPPNGFRVHEEDVDESRKVEGAKDEVGFPRNVAQSGGNGKREGGVEGPVGCLEGCR